MVLQASSVKISKNDLMFYYKLFLKIEKEELANLFYKANVTLIIKPAKDKMRKESHRLNSFMNIACKA